MIIAVLATKKLMEYIFASNLLVSSDFHEIMHPSNYSQQDYLMRLIFVLCNHNNIPKQIAKISDLW